MSNPNKQFYIDLPSDWEDKTIYTYMGPDDSGVQHILTLVIDNDIKGIELDEFARDRVEAVKESMSAIAVLKDETKELPSGRIVHEFVYKWVPTDDRIIFQKFVYMIWDNKGYTFSCNFSKKTIKTIGLQVDRIIDSFNPEGIPIEAE